jgi:hypothetical protein
MASVTDVMAAVTRWMGGTSMAGDVRLEEPGLEMVICQRTAADSAEVRQERRVRLTFPRYLNSPQKRP